MKILIYGGGFLNKGAQAMLLAVSKCIGDAFPDAEIIYTRHFKDISHKEFVIDSVKRNGFLYALRRAGGMSYVKAKSYHLMDIAIEMLTTKKIKRSLLDNYYKSDILDIDYIIDVSGFVLSSKFRGYNNRNYLDMIEYAHRCGIKVILMPQSFGPFDYKNKDKMVGRIKRVLRYPDIVFAREKDGYELLKNEICIDNVELSSDLVLQADSFDFSELFRNRDGIENIEIRNGSIAIIPNQKVLNNAEKVEDIYRLYDDIINFALRKEKHVYLIWHSKEDKKICETILNRNAGNEYIHFIERELYCYEYSEIVKKFDFVVASRYHSIIIAYRNGIPAVGLGWAVKYQELFESCEQGNYLVQVNDKGSIGQIEEYLSRMCDNYCTESDKIKRNVQKIQENSCMKKMLEIMSSGDF